MLPSTTGPLTYCSGLIRFDTTNRLPGEGRAPSLLQQGHIDVVPAKGS